MKLPRAIFTVWLLILCTKLQPKLMLDDWTVMMAGVLIRRSQRRRKNWKE